MAEQRNPTRELGAALLSGRNEKEIPQSLFRRGFNVFKLAPDRAPRISKKQHSQDDAM
jgi:hypothetical protein